MHVQNLVHTHPSRRSNSEVMIGGLMEADDDGNCVCRSSMLLLCEFHYLALFLSVMLVIAGATGYVCYLKGNRRRIADNIYHLKAVELRSKLGITIKQRVILSSERIPLWRDPKSFTVIRAESFDAAVGLDSFRDDIDIKQVDSFCSSLHSSICYCNICDWILQICKQLLNPADLLPNPTRERISESKIAEKWVEAFAPKNRPRARTFSDWLRFSTQEERLIYFRNRVCRLQILRDNNNALFHQLKFIVDDYMINIGKLCVNRHIMLSESKRGKELCSLNSLENFNNLSMCRKKSVDCDTSSKGHCALIPGCNSPTEKEMNG